MNCVTTPIANPFDLEDEQKKKESKALSREMMTFNVRLTAVKRLFQSLSEKVDDLTESCDCLSSRVSSLEDDLDELTSTVDNMEYSFECLSDNISDLNKSVSALPVEANDYF